MPRAQDVISLAVRRLETEVPAFARLKLVVRLELRGRGDVQVFRVRVPGPEITKGEPEDAQIEVSMARSDFNELAEHGDLKDWREAFDRGQVKLGGGRDIQRLLYRLVERQEGKTQTRKVH